MLEFTKIIKWLRILLEIMVKIMLFNLIDIYFSKYYVNEKNNQYQFHIFMQVVLKYFKIFRKLI